MFAIVMITGVLLHLARIMKTCPKCKKKTLLGWAKGGPKWDMLVQNSPLGPLASPKNFKCFRNYFSLSAIFCVFTVHVFTKTHVWCKMIQDWPGCQKWTGSGGERQSCPLSEISSCPSSWCSSSRSEPDHQSYVSNLSFIKMPKIKLPFYMLIAKGTEHL